MSANIGLKNKKNKIVLLLLTIILIILLFHFSPYVIIRYYGNGIHVVKRDVEFIENEQIYTSLGFSKLSNLKEVSIYCDKQSDLKLLKKMSFLKKLTITLENGECNLLRQHRTIPLKNH